MWNTDILSRLGCSLLPRLVLVIGVLLWYLSFQISTTSTVSSSDSRQLRSTPNAFAIVHDWLRQYQDSEQEAHDIGVMDPTDHALYGREVAIDTPPPAAAGITTFVVGGVPTETAASWMVMLLSWNADESQWQFAGCSGTLIASKFVLTAAHCVSVGEPVGWNAVLVQAFAPFERGNGGLDTHFSFVEAFYVHDDYINTRFDRDIALIRLARPVDTKTFGAIRLSESNFPIENNETVTILGFGMMDEDAVDHSNVLREVNVPFVSAESCRRYHGYQITNDMVCAGLQEGGKDACNGDSGGPLVRKLATELVQVGIVSWGDGCARAESPGVYSSVSYYYRWIADRVCANEDMQIELSETLCRIETLTPTGTPTSLPTAPPSRATPSPTPASTILPTQAVPESRSITPRYPSARPTMPPTHHPTLAPSDGRTSSPVTRPTGQRSSLPARLPVARPTRQPSNLPTRSPLTDPTHLPLTGSVSSPSNKPTVPGSVCLPLDSPCVPWADPPCCHGSCMEWWSSSSVSFTCTVVEEDSGKKSKSKKKGKSDKRTLQSKKKYHH